MRAIVQAKITAVHQSRVYHSVDCFKGDAGGPLVSYAGNCLAVHHSSVASAPQLLQGTLTDSENLDALNKSARNRKLFVPTAKQGEGQQPTAVLGPALSQVLKTLSCSTLIYTRGISCSI